MTNLIEKAKQYFNGLEILTTWIGSGGEVVSQELAQTRTGVCLSCPYNLPGVEFVEAAAALIKAQLALRHEMGLNTISDDRLHSCSKCSCPLPLKVWVPLAHLKKTTSDFTLMKLKDVENCWIRNEIIDNP